MEPYSPDVLWMVILGFIISFILAFGIGANDVANSFGTSVGSGVLTIRQACILATVCEISGAVLIGYKVSDTMRKGILDVTLYEGKEPELMLGCVAALISTAVWLLIATFFKLPISGTHSIVGATVGFNLVTRGIQGIKWTALGTIVSSWFISPIMSGIVSTGLFAAIRQFILRTKCQYKSGLRALPVFYGLTVFINVISIICDGPRLLHMDGIPTWIAITMSVAAGLFIAIIIQIFSVPRLKKKISKKLKTTGVNLNFEESRASTPLGSPIGNQRTISVNSDSKQFSIVATPKNIVKGHCEINSGIIIKAEELFSRKDTHNKDSWITSLTFIDEEYNNGRTFDSTTRTLCLSQSSTEEVVSSEQ